eukprot:scaffold456_cov390-Prasinococcus_capsulatus_cf.AAC.3
MWQRVRLDCRLERGMEVVLQNLRLADESANDAWHVAVKGALNDATITTAVPAYHSRAHHEQVILELLAHSVHVDWLDAHRHVKGVREDGGVRSTPILRLQRASTGPPWSHRSGKRAPRREYAGPDTPGASTNLSAVQTLGRSLALTPTNAAGGPSCHTSRCTADEGTRRRSPGDPGHQRQLSCWPACQRQHCAAPAASAVRAWQARVSASGPPRKAAASLPAGRPPIHIPARRPPVCVLDDGRRELLCVAKLTPYGIVLHSALHGQPRPPQIGTVVRVLVVAVASIVGLLRAAHWAGPLASAGKQGARPQLGTCGSGTKAAPCILVILGGAFQRPLHQRFHHTVRVLALPSCGEHERSDAPAGPCAVSVPAEVANRTGCMPLNSSNGMRAAELVHVGLTNSARAQRRAAAAPVRRALALRDTIISLRLRSHASPGPAPSGAAAREGSRLRPRHKCGPGPRRRVELRAPSVSEVHDKDAPSSICNRGRSKAKVCCRLSPAREKARVCAHMRRHSSFATGGEEGTPGPEHPPTAPPRARGRLSSGVEHGRPPCSDRCTRAGLAQELQ